MASLPAVESSFAGSTDRTAAQRVAAVSIAIASGTFVFAMAAGVIGSWVAALPAGVVAALGIGAWLSRRPWLALDGTASSRGLRIVSAVATTAALVELLRLTVFMVDPTQIAWSLVPSSNWESGHSCVSAYYLGAQTAAQGGNVYDESLYSVPNPDPAAMRVPRTIGPFRIDMYEYPPPFLVLPRLLSRAAPDFLRFRMLWFGLNGLVVLAAMIVVARALEPAAATRALLLAPLVWAAVPMLSTIQKGNVQLVVIAISMAAMVLFRRSRWAAGGALLAYATLSKLYPGLLGLYLVAQRRWRAVLWTVAWAVVITAVTWLDLGSAIFATFVEHFPRLLGGEAFPAFRNPAATAVNFSIPGIAFKLKLFGIPGMGFPAAKVLGWLYTLVVVPAVIVVARRAARDGETPQVWLGILILATLRSPFLPQAYAVFPPLWLLTLLAAVHPPTGRTLTITLVGWAALTLYMPMDWFPVRVLAIGTTLPQVVTILLAVLALRRPRRERAGAPGVTQPAA